MAASDRIRRLATLHSVKRMDRWGCRLARSGQWRGEIRLSGERPDARLGRRSSALPAASVRVVRCSNIRTQSAGTLWKTRVTSVSRTKTALDHPVPRTEPEGMFEPFDSRTAELHGLAAVPSVGARVAGGFWGGRAFRS